MDPNSDPFNEAIDDPKRYIKSFKRRETKLWHCTRKDLKHAYTLIPQVTDYLQERFLELEEGKTHRPLFCTIEKEQPDEDDLNGVKNRHRLRLPRENCNCRYL
jgi:hypothetical protein